MYAVDTRAACIPMGRRCAAQLGLMHACDAAMQHMHGLVKAASQSWCGSKTHCIHACTYVCRSTHRHMRKNRRRTSAPGTVQGTTPTAPPTGSSARRPCAGTYKHHKSFTLKVHHPGARPIGLRPAPRCIHRMHMATTRATCMIA